jgi:hypothetical protein
MRIMDQARQPLAKPNVRHDGWTPERRRNFLQCLAAGGSVRLACGRVGLTRQAAYKLRGREPVFALAWDQALLDARRAADAAFLAALPERLLRTMSALSGECRLGGRPFDAPDRVRVVSSV